MKIFNTTYISFVTAAKSTNEVFEQWELDAPTRPRFGRNWWYWKPTFSYNGGKFRRYENTDIQFHWLCFCVSLTTYMRGAK